MSHEPVVTPPAALMRFVLKVASGPEKREKHPKHIQNSWGGKTERSASVNLFNPARAVIMSSCCSKPHNFILNSSSGPNVSKYTEMCRAEPRRDASKTKQQTRRIFPCEGTTTRKTRRDTCFCLKLIAGKYERGFGFWKVLRGFYRCSNAALIDQRMWWKGTEGLLQVLKVECCLFKTGTHMARHKAIHTASNEFLMVLRLFYMRF